MTWGYVASWCLPDTMEMVLAVRRACIQSEAQCPGCGAILNSRNTDGICSPCRENLFLGRKADASLISWLRHNNVELYREIMSTRATVLTTRFH
jgi:hypothetical protein